jgi:predicted XRE-type DNA-binding protein
MESKKHKAMKNYKDLFKTKGYWMTKIQNDLYGEVSDYLESNEMNQSDFAKELNVSKGYVSQVMNGNFNFTLSKLIDLSLAINKVPFTWENLDKYSDKVAQETFTPVVSIDTKLVSINTTNQFTSVPADNYGMAS